VTPRVGLRVRQAGGTELIYTTGNDAVGFHNGIGGGGAVTPTGVYRWAPPAQIA